jgi:hypothetical protein
LALLQNPSGRIKIQLTGKTILASVIIEACESDPTFETCYFYCKYNDPERDNFTSVLKGLLGQLLGKCERLVPHCHDKYHSSGEPTLSSSGLAKQLLELFCDELPKIFIIIDGLDECHPSERKQTMATLRALVAHCEAYQPGKLRLLILSQYFVDIKNALSPSAVISLSSKDNEGDIKRYTKVWSSKIQQNFDLADDQALYIEDAVLARAQGISFNSYPFIDSR